VKPLSARFLKGIVKPDPILEDGTPQIAFIGRSNVGKSSLINSLTGQKSLARTSSFPGRTQEINVFIVEERYYWLDLPGYGYSRHSLEKKRQLHRLIDWYFFQSPYRQERVVLIIDAEVGPTDNDFEILRALDQAKKAIVIVANKADKIRKTKAAARLREIRALLGSREVIPYSSETGIGRKELIEEIFV
jgi:GTP-binding protein